MMQLSNQGESANSARFGSAPSLLLAFVALSILAHGFVLLFSADPTPMQPEPALGKTIISTTLIYAEKSTQNTPAKNTSHQHINKSARFSSSRKITIKKLATNTNSTLNTTPTANHSLHTTFSPAKPERMTIATKTAKPTTSAFSESLDFQKKKQRNYLLGELKNRLNRYLTYPQRARRRGWQGQVMVAFHINHHGQLNNVRLAESSGYSLLDRSAVTAISKLEYIALPDRLGPLHAMELLLPVSYQLREG